MSSDSKGHYRPVANVADIKQTSIKEFVKNPPRLKGQCFEDAVFDRGFITGQVIWWTILYHPNLRNWDREDVELFCRDFIQNVSKFSEACAADEGAAALADLAVDSGINVLEWSEKLHTSTRLHMIEQYFPIRGKGIDLKKQAVMLANFTEAFTEALAIGVYTLVHNFQSAPWYIEDTIVDYINFCDSYNHKVPRESLQKGEKPHRWCDLDTVKYFLESGIEVTCAEEYIEDRKEA